MLFSELRKDDEKCSDIISNFLEKNFYCDLSDFERVNDKKRQVQGIDVIFTYNDKKYICDEKCAVRYRNLQTFCLELCFINRQEKIVDGWLLDKDKVNNSFLFIWIDKAKKDVFTTIEDIEEIEFALIRKEKILNYLCDIGWNKQNLMYKVRKILNNENENLGNFKENKIKFSFSKHLVEKPINVLLKRNTLIQLSDLHKKIKNHYN